MTAKPPVPLRRHLIRTLLGLVIVSVLIMGSGFWLLWVPALKQLAVARVDALEVRARAQAQILVLNAERLARVAAAWLARDEPNLDHQSLNRRFMPLLAQYPEYLSLRIADAAGNEWLLARNPDDTWRNRLTAVGDKDVTHRFLIWQDTERLQQERREPSDYQPRAQSWFQRAMRANPGQGLWTEIAPLPEGGGPISMLALAVPSGQGRPPLMVALEVDLGHLVRTLMPHDQAALLILFTTQGQLLGHHHLPASRPGGMPPLFSSVLDLDVGPLSPGIRAWLGRDSGPMADILFLHGLEFWYAGFRALPLGDETLWLGIYLPLSELLPGLPYGLPVLLSLLILLLGLGYLLARRLAHRLSQPLGRLTTDLRRLEELDFSAPPPLACHLEEIARLAAAQEQTRRALQTACRYGPSTAATHPDDAPRSAPPE